MTRKWVEMTLMLYGPRPSRFVVDGYVDLIYGTVRLTFDRKKKSKELFDTLVEFINPIKPHHNDVEKYEEAQNFWKVH